MVDYGAVPGELLVQIVEFMQLDAFQLNLYWHKLRPLLLVNKHWAKCLRKYRYSRARLLRTGLVKKETKDLLINTCKGGFDEQTRLLRLVAINIPLSIPFVCISSLTHLELDSLDAKLWLSSIFPQLKSLTISALSGLDKLEAFLNNHPLLESLSIIQKQELPNSCLNSLEQLNYLHHVAFSTLTLDSLERIALLRPDISSLSLRGTSFVIADSFELASVLSKFTKPHCNFAAIFILPGDHAIFSINSLSSNSNY